MRRQKRVIEFIHVTIRKSVDAKDARVIAMTASVRFVVDQILVVVNVQEPVAARPMFRNPIEHIPYA